MSAVSVFVMDCTTIGASEPTRTLPTTTVTVFLRGMIDIWNFYFNTRRLSGFTSPCPLRTHEERLGCSRRGDPSWPATPASGRYPELVATNVRQSLRQQSTSFLRTA